MAIELPNLGHKTRVSYGNDDFLPSHLFRLRCRVEQPACPNENRIEHDLRESSGKRVLLAGMVRSQELVGAKHRFRLMTEPRLPRRDPAEGA